MKQSIEMGAVAPIISCGAVTTPTLWRDAANPNSRTGQAKVTMVMSEQSRDNGRLLMDLVRSEVKRLADRTGRHESAVRELRRLVSEIWTVVRQVPEFISYMQWLGRRDLRAVAHILSAVPPPCGKRQPSRGRPPQSFDYLVEMVDLVKEQEGGSVARACARLLEELNPSPFGHYSSARAMENAYAQHKERVDAKQQIWIEPSELARVPYVIRQSV